MIDLRVIVPFHNAAAFLPECLESIAAQTLRPHVYLVNDASTDEWSSILPRKFPGGFVGINRPERGEELASIVTGTQLAHDDIPLTPQTVIAHVCGDDRLSDPGALERLAQAYQDPDVWMAYGSFVHESGKPGLCRELPSIAHERGDYRARPWVTSHLRSYRYGLWRAIPPEQLVDPETGTYWQYGTDFAFMFPMLELARERARFIRQTNYIYRTHENNIPPSLYGDPCRRIRALPRLARLDSLEMVS